MSGISSNEKKSKHQGMLNWYLFLIVVILFEFLIFGAANQKFLNISSMFRSMNDFVPIGIIGIFVTLVMITGGIDIQAGSIVGLTSIIIGVAWQDWGMNIWAAVKRRAKREKSFCKEMQYLYGFEPLLTKGLKREKYAC